MRRQRPKGSDRRNSCWPATRMLPSAEDYSSDESGSIYDVVFGGIQNNRIEFEIRGYSNNDLVYPASGQTFTFPIASKTIQLRNIEIVIDEVQKGSLTYRIGYRK